MTNLSGLDAWSVISGAIGVLTVLPLIWAYVHTQHPETKLAALDLTLNDTEALLRSVVEEGLLHPVKHVLHFESRLRNLRAVADKLRDDTFITSVEWRKLLRAWYNGLTKDISAVCTQVKGVRANICETSASLRMQLPHADDTAPLPSHRRWRAKIVNFWRRILSLARFNRAFVDDDAGDSTPVASSTSTFDTITIVPSPDDAGSDTVAWDGDASTPEPDALSCLAPSRNNSLDHLSKSPHASSHTPRTASRTHELRVISRAIRQVDRELTSQGVTNARLAQLVQAMHMRWSPASSKARRLPRRLRQQHGLAPGPKHLMALQRTSDSATGVDPNEDDEWEETMCEP